MNTIDSSFVLSSLPSDIVNIVEKYSDYELSKGRALWDFTIPDSSFGEFPAFENNNFAFVNRALVNNNSSIVVFINFKFYSQFSIPHDSKIFDLRIIHGEIFLHFEKSIFVFNFDGCQMRSLSFGDLLFKNAFSVNSVGNLITCIDVSVNIYLKNFKSRIRAFSLVNTLYGIGILYGCFNCVNVDREDNIYLYGMHGRNVVILDNLGYFIRIIDQLAYNMTYVAPTLCKQFIINTGERTIIVNGELTLTRTIFQNVDDDDHVSITNSGHIIYCSYNVGRGGLVLSCFH